MIPLHVCCKSVDSCLKVPENQERSNFCKICGGILSINELGGLARRMSKTVGPSRLIDSELKWKTSSNCKPRALRRARTFTQENSKKFTMKNMKDSEDIFDRGMKNEGDIMVSESEKLGVSILGRRFSDNPESFPIKKRFSFLLSQPPSCPSSSSIFDQCHANNTVIFHNNHDSVEQDKPGGSPSCTVDCGQARSILAEKSSLDDIDTRQVLGPVDFSGISILAAAASIERELMDAAGQPVQGYPSIETQLLSRISELDGVGEYQPSCDVGPENKKPKSPLRGEENQPSCDLGNNKPKSPLVPSASIEVLVRSSGDGKKKSECDGGNSFGSIDSSTCKIKMPSSSDGRLHWDLNTNMEAWENLPKKKLEFELNDKLPILRKVRILDGDGRLDGEYVNPKSDHCGSDDVIVKVGELSTINHDQHCLGKSSEENFCDMFEVKNDPGNGMKTCLVTTDAFLVEGVAKSVSDTKMVDVSEEEKHEANSVSFNMEVHTDNNIPHPVIDDAIVVNTINACDPLAGSKMLTETFHAESTTITTFDSCSEHSKKCQSTYDRLGEQKELRRLDAEKYHPLSTTVALTVATQQSVTCQLDKDMCGMMVHGVHENASQVSNVKSNSKSMTSEGCLSDETVCCHELDALALQSKILFKSRGKSYEEQVPHRSAFVINHDKNSASVKLEDKDNTCCLLSDKNLCFEEVVPPINFGSKHTTSDLEGMMQGTNSIPPVVDASSSLDGCRISTDCHHNLSVQVGSPLKCSGQVSLEEEFSSEYQSDASPTDADDATGMERVEFLGDDDSQYEDGELRESILNIWGDDGAEEVEADHVDYESDGRETDFIVDGSAFKSQTDLAVESKECKQQGMLASSHIDEDRLLIAESDSQSKHFQKRNSIQDASIASCRKGDVELDMLKVSKENVFMGNAIEVHTSVQSRLLPSDGAADVDDAPGKSSKQAYPRLKSSGWDKMPGVDASVNSLWNVDHGSFAQSAGMESLGGTSVSSIRKNASSGTEISKFFEASFRKEVSHARASRKHDPANLNTEGNNDTRGAIGRDWLSFHAQGKSRGDCWVGSPDHHVNSLYDTSGCHSSASFARSCSRNAAAAAIAKVESNGFVVAPDGTIVKAGGLGSCTHVSSRSLKSSTHSHSIRVSSPMECNEAFGMTSVLGNSRELCPDRRDNIGWVRGRRYGSGMAIPPHRYGYHSPMADSRNDSEPLHHPLPGREHSFSPHRRPIHLSREPIRSPSRSRTRSPRSWASPIGRNDGRVNGLLNVRRHSRSPPNFKSRRRLFRQSSHQCQAISGEHPANYAPVSRNNSSHLLESRWIDDKNLEDQHQHRQPSGRSSPNRLLLRGTRLDRSDSRRRMKLDDDYHQPLHSGRFDVYAGCGRGSKYGGYDDDRRGRSNRYDLLPSEGHFENNGNMNRFHFDDDSFRAQDAKPKSSRFQQREVHRVLDDGIGGQHGVFPRRFKGEMRHFGHSRHG